MEKILLENCVESAEAAVAAQAGGADRVELCDNLFEGGTTPSAGSILLARKHLSIKLHVIIRPRGGDFLYSDTEFAVMKADIAFCKDAGVDGVVIGLLKADGQIDVERTAELIALARPLSVTFHRAFDVCADPFVALEQLVALGVDRILTSGQASTVLEGSEMIEALISRAAGRIGILPGGGITPRNLERIVNLIKPKEVHMVAWAPCPSSMQLRSSEVFMGGELRPPEFDRLATHSSVVRELTRILGAARKDATGS